MNPQLPIILTFFRLAVGLLFVPLAYYQTPRWFFMALLLAGLLSDIADGMIARRIGVATLALRRLDTRVDLIFYGCAAFAALTVSAFPLSRLWPWLIAYLVLFLLRNLVDYFRYHASPSYHMWSGKLWSVVLFVHLICLFCGAHALFLLPVGFILYAINSVEGIVASLVLPEPTKDIASIFHVFHLRKCS